jgi:polyisoprenoid-binding protein YceI
VLNATLNKAGVHPMTKAQSIGFDASGTLKRSEFGLGAYVPMVSDEIKLNITTEGSVPKAAGAP